MKNYGLKIDPPSEKDFVFGASLPFEELTDGNWEAYLPVVEYQNKGFEPYACVSFTILSCVEALIKRKYGIETNWSDRYLAALSGTKEGGNSPRVVADYLRKEGVVPEEIYPYDATSFEEYYKEIPEDIKRIAQEFTKNWDFGYEKVPNEIKLIEKALKCSPLGISVYAWVQNADGDYYNPGGDDNHFTTLYRIDDKKRAFDTYDNTNKALVKDMPHAIIQRYWIAKKKKQQNWLQELLTNLWDFFVDIIRWDFRTFGARRSSEWRDVRNSFARKNPTCAVCGKKPIQVHHKKPFHLQPELELDPTNLISLCRQHHLWFGHLGSYYSYNDTIEKDAELWYNKIKSRP